MSGCGRAARSVLIFISLWGFSSAQGKILCVGGMTGRPEAQFIDLLRLNRKSEDIFISNLTPKSIRLWWVHKHNLQKRLPLVKVKEGVDATALHTVFKANSFDHIIFVGPAIELDKEERKQDKSKRAALNLGLIRDFLQSAVKVSRSVFIVQQLTDNPLFPSLADLQKLDEETGCRTNVLGKVALPGRRKNSGGSLAGRRDDVVHVSCPETPAHRRFYDLWDVLASRFLEPEAK